VHLSGKEKLMRSRTLLWLAGVLALLLAACAGEDTSDDGGDAPPALTGTEDEIVWRGKEDNFRALSAREYLLTGVVPITLEAEYADRTPEERLVRVQELIPLKSIQVGWFLNVFLIEKKADDANHGYGGYHALVREGSYKSADVQVSADDPLTYTFEITFEIGGENDLLANIKELEQIDGETYRFKLAMARVPNADLSKLDINSEWYRSFSSWKPDGQPEGSVQYVELTVRPEERSSDGYFDYQALFADGKATVGVHFGWDYHKEYHLRHSEALYEWLIGRGFESPVASYADYVPGGPEHSGPLTRTIEADGEPLLVEISLFWGKPETVTDPDTPAGGIILENDMRASLAERDIIAYSGHSGPFYGFALANWKKTDEGDLDDAELPEVEMPADAYQIVLAEGCDTYAIGEAFWHNPAKADRRNLDVITTTAPSNASTPSTVQDFLNAMIGTDSKGRHVPRRVDELLKDLDGNSYWFHTMYGVHGVDDNPRRHPYADEDLLCQAGCEAIEDCGGIGNRCVSLGAGQKVCTFECAADDGCPEGYSCERIASSGSMQRSFSCVPRSQRCGEEPGGEHGTLEQGGTVAKDEEHTYTIELGTSVPRLQVLMTGDGDADLYVRHGEAPTDREYECRPYSANSDEECTFDGPKAGTWHVRVVGWAASSTYDLKASW